ncbi:MAG: hypothetical protein PHU55_04615, partial [Bacilli bacterium]|nr:hypothetical protein [Bacilli bacterium]
RGYNRYRDREVYDINNVYEDVIETINDSAFESSQPVDNFVDHWVVGDIAVHQKFGEGVVTKVLDDTIVEINFYEHGKKSILAKHFMLSKKGGVAKA